MKPIAIIPARGGSKRLPRKNVRPVGGRPMLAWPVEAARDSGEFARVVVSTDDEAIADVAEDAGAEVHMRPAGLGADRATVAQVCAELLEGMSPEARPPVFCCLYATALFVRPSDFAASRALLDAPPPADVVMGVSAVSPHPVQALVEDEGYLRAMWPEYEHLQSQDYPHLVASNGTIYWARTAPFLQSGSFYSPRLRGYEMPRERAVDIDTAADFAFAERLFATDPRCPRGDG